MTEFQPNCFVCGADVSSWLMDPDQPDGPRVFHIHVCKISLTDEPTCEVETKENTL